MADATAADPSVGVWDQLHCFFFAWGFPSSLRPGSGLAPTVKGPSPSPLPSSPAWKKQWSCPHTPTEGSADFGTPARGAPATSRRTRDRLVGCIAERAHSCIVTADRVERSAPPKARTAALTFNHQLDAIEVEDVQAPHRPAQKLLPEFCRRRPSFCNCKLEKTYFLVFYLLFIFFAEMGQLHRVAFHKLRGGFRYDAEGGMKQQETCKCE